LACIRARPEQALRIAARAHARARAAFDLPARPPRAREGIRCGLCARDCRIAEGARGFCGLRTVESGRLIHLAGTPHRGLLHWYRDPLPTNCVADWVCSGHARRGHHNLAVFYASCTLDCLFCQNWHFREADPRQDRSGGIQALSARSLVKRANPQTHCACFFGGDPASQMPHALAAAKGLAARGITVCWETAGTMHPKFLDRALALSIESGGWVKFDLKAFDENLHRALTGASNRRTLENLSRAVERLKQKGTDTPRLVASTPLLPGYLDVQEVTAIARFISARDPRIPYALLGFFPHFLFHDLPRTSLRHAQDAAEAAHAAGLKSVRVGNRHLLSQAY
jgi:pyruvate formate lyase activating enzyme